jgi:hypothetical protein
MAFSWNQTDCEWDDFASVMDPVELVALPMDNLLEWDPDSKPLEFLHNNVTCCECNIPAVAEIHRESAYPLRMPGVTQPPPKGSEIVKLALQILKKDPRSISPPNRKRELSDTITATKKESDRPQHKVPRTSCKMDPFPPTDKTDWKHVLYNLLVENYNSDDKNTLLLPTTIIVDGKMRDGFTINEGLSPKIVLAELYAFHVRKESLQALDAKSSVGKDLYRFYLRSAYQLMSKYFTKVGKWTYIYDEVPLFVPGEDLAAARDRVKMLDTKQRRKLKKRARENWETSN